MHYIGRTIVCERLGIRPSASYLMLPGSGVSSMVRSDSVISLLNGCRRGMEGEVDFIPSDLVSADELEEETGIPAKKIIAWTRRKVRVPPHYRITSRVIRFRRSSIERWIGRLKWTR